jgi:hypothetical protein
VTEIVVTVVCRGANAPADVVRITNTAINSATCAEVRIEKKETGE